MLLALLALTACSGSGSPPSRAITSFDTQADSGRVQVAHDRELRGVWVATVWNINWPSSSSLSASEMRSGPHWWSLSMGRPPGGTAHYEGPHGP